MKVLGSILREARERRHRTRAEVAKDVGVCASHWGRIEAGKSTPSVVVLFRACLILEIGVGAFQGVVDAS